MTYRIALFVFVGMVLICGAVDACGQDYESTPEVALTGWGKLLLAFAAFAAIAFVPLLLAYFHHSVRSKMFPDSSRETNSAWSKIKSFAGKPDTKVEHELKWDNPRVDYGGYEISNPYSEYAARNLPATNDPEEIQGRKWQAKEEEWYRKAPVHSFDVGYWRGRGRDIELASNRKQETITVGSVIEKIVGFIISVLFLGLLFYAIYHSHS